MPHIVRLLLVFLALVAMPAQAQTGQLATFLKPQLVRRGYQLDVWWPTQDASIEMYREVHVKIHAQKLGGGSLELQPKKDYVAVVGVYARPEKLAAKTLNPLLLWFALSDPGCQDGDDGVTKVNFLEGGLKCPTEPGQADPLVKMDRPGLYTLVIKVFTPSGLLIGREERVIYFKR